VTLGLGVLLMLLSKLPLAVPVALMLVVTGLISLKVKNYVRFIFSFFFQILGVIALNKVGQYVGLGNDEFTASLSFNTVASPEFYKFFFGSEFLGIFLFTVFTQKAGSAPEGVPAAFWTILLVAVAFWIGGASTGFGFVPARSFSTFKHFGMASSWATLVVQFWAATLATVVLDFCWN